MDDEIDLDELDRLVAEACAHQPRRRRGQQPCLGDAVDDVLTALRKAVEAARGDTLSA